MKGGSSRCWTISLKMFTNMRQGGPAMLTAAARVDTLGYFDRLMTAGVPEAQARVQAELFREQADFQGRELQQTIEKYDEARRKEIATRGDVQDVRLEIEKVRAETEKSARNSRPILKRFGRNSRLILRNSVGKPKRYARNSRLTLKKFATIFSSGK